MKLKKGEPLRFKLEDTERKTVEAMKEKLTTPPVLALPQLNGQYTIDTDACDTQVGCELLQEHED